MSLHRGPVAEQFLSEAARVLALSLDYEATITGLAQLAVPTFADWCFVDLVSDDGASFERVAVGHQREDGKDVAETLKRRYPLRMDRPAGVALALLQHQPQLLIDIGEDFAESVAQDGEHLSRIRALHMRSAVIAPMFARGRPIGALSLIACDRNFDEADVWFVAQLAHNAAPAIDNARLFESERRARIRVTKLQEVTAAFSRASTVEEVSEAACRIGTEAMEGYSGALWLTEPDGSLALSGSWGTPAEYIAPFRVIAADSDVPASVVQRTGQPLWVETADDYRRASPELFDRALAAGRLAAFGAVPVSINGRVAGVMTCAHALGHGYDQENRAFFTSLAQHCSQALERARLLETERQLLESERRSNMRLRLLGRTGETLALSLGLDEMLQTVAKELVPALADWCVFDLIEGKAIRRVAIEHRDPEKLELVRRISASHRPEVGDGSPLARVIADNTSHFQPRVATKDLEKSARDPEQLALYRGIGLISVITVPLSADGTGIGALSLTTTSDSGRVYDEADFAFARELGRRVGIALGSARLRVELQEAHGRMLRLFNQAPMSIAIYRGRELRIEFANPTYLHVRSRGPEIVGQNYSDVFPEAAVMGRPALERAFESGQPLTYPEVRAMLDRGNGPEEAFFHASFVALKGEADEVERVMSVSFEVTDRVLARRALDKERTEADAARRDAEAANRAKDDFLAMLGHELRNPLAPITTALNLMELRSVSGADRELAVITRQVQHLTRLVDDLLDVSRIIRGKIDLVRTTVELAELVSRALETASPLFEQRNQYVHVAVPRHGLLVFADPARMTQALSNLFTNAAKYTDAGGHISVIAEYNADFVTLNVRDDGVGIRADMLSQIFDLFVQERQAIDRARGGLGLGLAIVKSVITLHGGEIRAESAGPGRGSQFSVRLPLLKQAEADPAEKPPRPLRRSRPALSSEQVLVVDDNEDAAEMLSVALHAAGHVTALAHDGPSALAVLKEFSATAALLDLGLPAMDGYELAGHIKAAYPGVRLIALTGYGQESDRKRTRAAGFHEHLVKPTDIEHVLRALTRR